MRNLSLRRLSPHAAWDGGREEIVVDGKHGKNIASCPVILIVPHGDSRSCDPSCPLDE